MRPASLELKPAMATWISAMVERDKISEEGNGCRTQQTISELQATSAL